MDIVDYKAFLEYSPIGYAYHEIIVNEDNKPVDYVFLEVNTAFENITGLRRADILGKAVTEVIPAIREESFDWIGRYGEIALQGGHMDFEQYNVRFNKWFRVTAYSPKKYCFVTCFHDITQEFLSQQALRDSEERYRAIFQNMPSGMNVFEAINEGQDFIFKDFNPMAEKIGKASREEVVGRRLLELFPGVTRYGLFDALVRVYRTGNAEYIPASHYGDNQRSGWAEYYIFKLPSGDIAAIYNDVSRQKNAERQLQKSEERLRFAMDATSDGLWDWNVRTGRVYWSARAYTMLGYEPNEFEVSMEKWQSLLHPEDKDRILQHLSKKLYDDAANGFFMEFRFLTKQNTWKWVVGRGKVVEVDSEEKPLRLVGTHVDITERKQMELELLQSKQRAETADMAKTRFLANMSHELRTPLNGIHGMLQLLGLTAMSEDQKEYVRDCRDACNRMLRMVNNLMEMTVLQSDAVKLQESPCLLEEVVKSAVIPFKTEALAKGLHLGWTIADNVPKHLVCDEEKISSVLLQLLDNAVKFTESGSVSVSIDASYDKADKVKVFFSVQDTGIGIPEDKQKELCRSFFQVDDSYTKRFHGAGMGLALVKYLVEIMGGVLCIESKTGTGSKFVIILELKPDNWVNINSCTEYELTKYS